MGADAVKLVYLTGLALWAGWIVYSGRAELYIHPRFSPALAAAAWALAALALSQAFRLIRQRRFMLSAWRLPAGRAVVKPLGAGVRYGLLTLPLLFALLPGGQVLGGDYAAHKSLRHAPEAEAPAGEGFFSGLQAHFHDPDRRWFGGTHPPAAREGLPAAQGDAPATREGTPPAGGTPGGGGQDGAPPPGGDGAKKGGPAKAEPVLFDERNFLSLLMAINQEPGQFVDRPVEISGFLVDAPAGGEGLYIGRYVVNCCVADTVIMGLPVENTERWMKGEDKIKVGDWVKGTGRLQKAVKAGAPGGLIVSLKELAVESRPRNPYIYAE
ncbi:DUF1980 domain-containing protein [Heliobacterium gestii]|uniref:DUF1980 domain-containing protein n=1 Tax=Heliomicrobium gestii TaxID=2699 RepID=A0A845LMQ9_HELGE|nr:DUF1980 domain-containing protein [Heliomicrobium gestii]MBM7867783.1 putative repeat protein (TIGR03943 family) [Heliomicrobium gestii]MZP44176.1 DUF1980 domain-containing protein [Heliomicrobium gestii]